MSAGSSRAFLCKIIGLYQEADQIGIPIAHDLNAGIQPADGITATQSLIANFDPMLRRSADPRVIGLSSSVGMKPLSLLLQRGRARSSGATRRSCATRAACISR